MLKMTSKTQNLQGGSKNVDLLKCVLTQMIISLKQADNAIGQHI